MLMNFMKNLRKSEAGATAIEYGLIAALVAIVAIGALTAVGDNLKATFTKVGTSLETSADTSSGG